MQTAPRRRNPSGSRGLRPHTSSLVVSDLPGQHPPRSSSVARKPLLRDPREFVATLLIVAFLCRAAAIGADDQQSAPATASFEVPLDRSLQRHVHEGLVDYQGISTDADFSAAIKALAELDPDKLATRSERLAFWINTYNALVIRGVIDNQPIESVQEIGLAGGWSFFSNTRFVVGGKPRTLDGIEHGIIRPRFEDPRAHFALECGALGCPALRA